MGAGDGGQAGGWGLWLGPIGGWPAGCHSVSESKGAKAKPQAKLVLRKFLCLISDGLKTKIEDTHGDHTEDPLPF